MPRGRQYYDPIEQHPAIVGGEKDLARIELYPEGDAEDPNPKWRGRRITEGGLVAEILPGDFDHDRALAQAQSAWADLPVYELRSAGEDSTWEGQGPSPRLWAQQSEEIKNFVPDEQHETAIEKLLDTMGSEQAASEPTEEQAQLRMLPIRVLGNYVLLDDICDLLELWAAAYEADKNPSAAMALREAVDTLKEVG